MLLLIEQLLPASKERFSALDAGHVGTAVAMSLEHMKLHTLQHTVAIEAAEVEAAVGLGSTVAS